MKRWIVSLLLAAVLLGTLALTNQADEMEDPTGYTIEMASAVTLNEEFSVDIGICNNPGIITLRFRVVYDSTKLQLLRVEDRELLRGFIEPNPNISSPYTLFWLDATAPQDNMANGTVATLTFKALQEGADFSISVEPIESRNMTGGLVGIGGAKSFVSVQPPTSFGDVNEDGVVNSADRTTLARALAGWEGYAVAPVVADVNRDGEVTAADRTYLARVLAGWEGYSLS